VEISHNLVCKGVGVLTSRLKIGLTQNPSRSSHSSVFSVFSVVAFSSPSPDAKGEREARGYGNFALGERFPLFLRKS
jgi:hypothetical protein